MMKKQIALLVVVAVACVRSAFSQCSGCSVNLNSSASNISVNTGVTVCINSGATMSGQVTMNGGVLCNNGTINNLVMHAGRGTILNNGTIHNNESYIGLIANYYIYCNASSVFDFDAVTLNFINGDSLYFNIASGGRLEFASDLSIAARRLAIDNSGELAILGGINISGAQLRLTNTASGEVEVTDAINLTNAGSKVIWNAGRLLASGGINVGGTGNTSHTVTVSNSGSLTVNGDLACTMVDGNLHILNSAVTSGNFYVEGDLALREESNSFVNNGHATLGSLTTNSGGVVNSGTLTVTGLVDVAGTYTNSGEQQASDFNIDGAASALNTGSINLSGNFTNSGNLLLGGGSFLNTSGYTHSGGSIVGPASASGFEAYAKLYITGSSHNSGALSGYIKVYDTSLLTTTANVGFGFDVVTNAWLISAEISYLNTSAGPFGNPTVLVDCSGLQSYYFISINKEQLSPCPGTPVFLGVHLWRAVYPPSTMSAVSVPFNQFTATITPNNGTGNYVTPMQTTTYTITCTLTNGCSFSQTITINVTPVTYPTISYSPVPYFSTSSLTFPVNQTGPTGGAYSAVPTLSIDPVTGLITPTASPYGTYTVSYYLADIADCGPYTATCVVVLENLACNPVIEPNRVKMCEGEKIKVIAAAGVDGYTMTPAAGLSCTNCASFTVTAGPATTIYTLTSSRSGSVCDSFQFTVQVKPDCVPDELVGCCFSNYGASVTLNSSDTYINVYCNVVNELGLNTGTNVVKGRFTNYGTVQVLLYWIHNAKNNLYMSSNGVTRFFGADQKIKGNSHTWFNHLHLEGNGTKSIWIDTYNTANLYLYSNVLAIQNFTFFMKNVAATISRSSGYASNGLEGYFSAAMDSKNNAPAKTYLFPLGAAATATAPFRYRPLVMANATSTLGDEISANFINRAPSLLSDPVFTHTNAALQNNVNNLSPSVIQVNNAFYHKIKNTQGPPVVTSNLTIQSYYFPADGSFQSLAEWEKDPSQVYDWWGITPGASASFSPSADAGTPGMIYAQTSGTLNFNSRPFTLSRGGFYVNTAPFGNGNGTSITLSATPSANTNAPTPSGGGLNNSYGTGSSSGNSGNGGPTVFEPVPVAGDYVMTIWPANDCAVPGKVKFTIDQNGNIAPASVLYGLSTSTNYLGQLSRDVYTIDNVNSGITFSATPKAILANCINSITVATSVGNDFVFDKTFTSPTEKINVYLPPLVQLPANAFRIYNSAGTLMNSPGYSLSAGGANVLTLANPASYAVGVYTFKFNLSYTHPITLQTVSDEVQGQFIIK